MTLAWPYRRDFELHVGIMRLGRGVVNFPFYQRPAEAICMKFTLMISRESALNRRVGWMRRLTPDQGRTVVHGEEQELIGGWRSECHDCLLSKSMEYLRGNELNFSTLLTPAVGPE